LAEICTDFNNGYNNIKSCLFYNEKSYYFPREIGIRKFIT